MTWSAADLPWLPPAPKDLRARCKAIDEMAEDQGAAVRELAGHALDLNGLTRLAKTIGRCADTGLTLFRLGLLSNATTDLLAPALIASAARHGLVLEVVAAPFDQAVQQALDPASNLHRMAPDAVLLAFDHRLIARDGLVADDQDAAADAVAGTLAQIDMIRDGLRAGCGAPAILQTIVPPPEPLLGSLDALLPGAAGCLAAAVNTGLAERARESSDIVFDAAALAATVGLDAWHDPGQWHLAKLAFAQNLVPLYAEHLGRLLGALRGKSRKCLVLDLDNTLWGGVIGDDGLDGIVLGHGDPGGEVFLAVQQLALDLKRHGVVLAVSSKNEDAIAREPFRGHPDMILHEDDIAIFQANWRDKASNLEAIAAALNLGVDALVLLDDNPAERAHVRAALPSVAVPELPEDPAFYPRALTAAGYFEAVSFSADDRRRAADYQATARRVQLQGQARDIEGYLRSLDMRISFAPFDPVGRPRVTQLINKSNQFNLTTRRYTEAEVEALEADPAVFTLQVRLRDTFGDSGMISVVICRRDGTAWEVDTWLMSCRVLGRRVEEAVLAEIARQARKAGADRINGRYIPTDRNDLVREHFAKLGFAAEGSEGEATLWRLDLAGYTTPDLPMAVA